MEMSPRSRALQPQQPGPPSAEAEEAALEQRASSKHVVESRTDQDCMDDGYRCVNPGLPGLLRGFATSSAEHTRDFGVWLVAIFLQGGRLGARQQQARRREPHRPGLHGRRVQVRRGAGQGFLGVLQPLQQSIPGMAWSVVGRNLPSRRPRRSSAPAASTSPRAAPTRTAWTTVTGARGSSPPGLFQVFFFIPSHAAHPRDASKDCGAAIVLVHSWSYHWYCHAQ